MMKRYIFIIIATFVALATMAQQKPDTLRVMSYNLHFGKDATTDELAAQIKALNPDFVALQELDIKTYRTYAPHQNGVDMLSELAMKTGMFGFFGRTIKFAGGYYGIGILSKYPCVESQCMPLPNPDGGEQRAMLKGVFHLNSGRDLCFVSTHLDVKKEINRTEQIQFIINQLKDITIPVVMGGDFNAMPGSTTIDVALKNLCSLTANEPTFPVVNPTEKIDYLFSFNVKPEVLVTKVIAPDEKNNSDHRPVLSTIVIK